jgi:parvulin-like peptidyl-prolyl isomerase
MRNTHAVAIATLTLALAATALADAVLKVNGAAVTPGQLAIAKFKVTDDVPSLTGNEAAVTRKAVDLLVADFLLADAAREAGVTLSEKDLKKGIVAMQAKLGGKTAFADQLKNLGASNDELKELAERRMLAQRYVETAIAPAVTVTEDEARAYYETPENQVFHGEQIRLRVIFVNAPPGIGEKEEAKARARIDEAERRVLAGEDFDAVAREVSDDMSKANGGDFGWIGSEAIPAQFLGKVWAIQPGEVSDVLRGPFSFVLMQVLEKRPRGPFPFEERKDDVMTQLRKSKVETAVAALVGTRRATASVEGLTAETAAALQR